MRKPLSAAVYQIVSLLLLAAVIAAIARWVPVAKTLGELQQWMAAAGLWAPIVYPAIVAVCNILLLPAGVLTIGGGFFFGLWWGFLLVLVGNVISAAGAFWIGRKLGRRRIEPILQRRPKWAHLDEAIEREGWKIIVLSQLHPLFPVSLINYVYGITRIQFWPCMFWTLVGRVPGIFLYAYLGTLGQFGLNLMRGQSQPSTTEYVFWIGGLVCLFALTAALGRVALRLLQEAERKAHEEQVRSLATNRRAEP